MPRAGFHYNLGTSRGPDKIGSRAGPGPRAVHVVAVDKGFTSNQVFHNIIIIVFYCIAPYIGNLKLCSEALITTLACL